MLRSIAVVLPWLVLVTVFSLVPELPHVPRVSEDVAAVAGHFLVYAVMAALLYRLHMHAWPDAGGRWRPVYSAVFAIVVAACVGLGFEVMQKLFTETRSFQVEDEISNTMGATVAALSLLYLELSGSRLGFVLPGVFGIGAVLVVLATASYIVWDPTLPYAGDHWHAPYRVRICGEWQAPFQFQPGAIHTHGDGVIHIHPVVGEGEGKDANLAAFFESVDGELTDDSLTLPSGETYRDGDLCPDGSTGMVFASVWETGAGSSVKILGAAADYVPRNRELIVIEFGPEPDN